MAPTFDQSNEWLFEWIYQYPEAMKRQQELMRRKRGPNMMLLLPLIYAPVLPLIRITLKRQPVLRDRLFYGVLAGAFLHGTYLVTDLYDVENK